MKLPQYVRRRSRLVDKIPTFRKARGEATPFGIFLRGDVYDDLLKENPKPENIVVLIHEEKHRKHQKEMGIFMFGVKYYASRKFRFEEELSCYISMMEVMKKNKIKFDIEGIARKLSGPMYYWSIDYKTAKFRLESAWKKIK